MFEYFRVRLLSLPSVNSREFALLYYAFLFCKTNCLIIKTKPNNVRFLKFISGLSSIYIFLRILNKPKVLECLGIVL